MERDPFEVSLTDKVDLCLRADEALAGKDIVVRQAMARAQREHKLLLTSDGTEVEQELVECGAGIDCASAGDGVFQQRSYPSAHVGSSAPVGLGVRRTPRPRWSSPASRRAGGSAPPRG